MALLDSGRKEEKMKLLQLLIIFSIFSLTKEFEVKTDHLENFGLDVSGVHPLRGLTDLSSNEQLVISSETSLIKKQLPLHNDKDLDGFLEHLDKQMMEDWWRSVSEMSPSFRQKVLVLTGSTNSPDREMRQENSLDPQKCVPVSMKFLYNQSCMSELDSNTEGEIFSQNQQTGSGFSGSSHEHLTLKLKPGAAAGFSPHGNTTTNSGVHLLKASMVHGPKEPNQENPQIYEAMDKPDLVSSSRTPQRPEDPILEFDHQQILMLEDDEVVRTSAASLYEKHPAVSSVHVVGPQLRVQQVKGQPVVLSEHSSLVLVGHGARDHSGEMRISGYTYKDVVRIIQSTSRISEKIQTTTVLACDVGSDQRFREALLKKLHEAGIETELHLWNTVVQVTETGEVISQDVSADGPQWRSGDHTKKVVLTVRRNGEIWRRKESDQRGQEVLTDERRFLVRKEWPEEPRTFIDPQGYEKVVSDLTKSENVDQNKVEQVKQIFRILESLTWRLFYPEPEPPALRRVSDQQPNPDNYLIGIRHQNNFHLMDNNGKQGVLERCYVIENGTDIRNIIRHYAKDGEDEDSYLLINNWIFLVKPGDLYVYPFGKRLEDGNDRETENLQNSIMDLIAEQTQPSKEQYNSIRNHIQPSERDHFVTYLSNIFQGQPVYLHFNPEMFVIWYFTASVIAESARNFRTFPLTLMALSMNDNRFWFDYNFITMAAGGSWLDVNLRGFSGSGAGYLDKLAALLGKEFKVMRTWQDFDRGKRETKEEIFTEIARTAVEFNILEQGETNEFIENCSTFFNSAKAYQSI